MWGSGSVSVQASWGRGPGPTHVSWPGERARERGLARPPTTLHQTGRKIVPLWVSGHDQADFPGSGPSFQAGFALDGGAHVAVRFGVDQAVEVVPSGECRSDAFLMLANPVGEVAGYAQVQRPVRAVGHDVNPAGGHGWDGGREWLRTGLRWNWGGQSGCGGEVVGGRTKSGHDTGVGAAHNAAAGAACDTRAGGWGFRSECGGEVVGGRTKSGHDTRAGAAHDAGVGDARSTRAVAGHDTGAGATL